MEWLGLGWVGKVRLRFPPLMPPPVVSNILATFSGARVYSSSRHLQFFILISIGVCGNKSMKQISTHTCYTYTHTHMRVCVCKLHSYIMYTLSLLLCF